MVDLTELERDVESAIQHEMGGDTPGSRYLYRGTTLSTANQSEFRQNAIDGRVIDVWQGELTDEEMESVDFAQGMWREPFDDFERYDIPVTGGLTDTLGTAVHFSTTDLGSATAPMPVVIYLDTSKIQSEIHKVRYDPEWFDQHPGVLAWVDTLSSGEVFVNGRLEGLVDLNMDERPVLQHWPRKQVEARATSPTYSDENEVVAIAGEIDLDGAAEATAQVFFDSPASTTSPESALRYQPGYTTGFSMDEEDISGWSDRERCAELHDIWLSRSQYAPDQFYTILLDDRSLTSGDERVEREDFIFAYDGQTFHEDPSAIPSFLLGR